MQKIPLIALLGAPHTGVSALALALQQHLGTKRAQVVCGDAAHLSGASTASAVENEAATPAEAAAPGAADLTLLMGLDLPCPAGERPRQEAADQQLRSALDHAGVAYKVVYGHGNERLIHALSAINNIAARAYPSSARATFDVNNGTRAAQLRAWNCEKCSDPECEHRLFTRLTDARSAAAP